MEALKTAIIGVLAGCIAGLLLILTFKAIIYINSISF